MSETYYSSTNDCVVAAMTRVGRSAAAMLAGMSVVTAVAATQLALELDDGTLRQYLSVAVGASAVVMLR